MLVQAISKDIGTNKEKEICLPNKEYLRDHRCERTNMDYKCKIFEALNLMSQGHYYFVYIYLCR